MQENQSKRYDEGAVETDTHLCLLPYVPLTMKEAWPLTMPIVCEESVCACPIRKFGMPDMQGDNSLDMYEDTHLLHLRHVLVDRAARRNPVRVLLVELVLACAPLGLRPRFVAALHCLCRDFGVLLVVDEIFTRWRCGTFLLSTSEWYLSAAQDKGQDSVADIIVMGKMGMGVVLMHNKLPHEIRGTNTCNMTINGSLVEVRPTPMMRGCAFEQIMREIAALRSLGKHSNSGLLEMAGTTGKAVASKIISDLSSETSGKKNSGTYYQCVGLGCHLFVNTLLRVQSRANADVRTSLCETLSEPRKKGATKKGKRANYRLPSECL
jgi:hypothetical protein